MDNEFMVLPDLVWALAAATLLVAAAALTLAPVLFHRVGALMLVRALRTANDNEEGYYASPRSRLRCV